MAKDKKKNASAPAKEPEQEKTEVSPDTAAEPEAPAEEPA